MDAIEAFKAGAKQGWSTFAQMEMLTGAVAPVLLRHAQIARGANLLDVACGTGVVALTAARAGAKVTGLDFTPELIARAKENAALMRIEATFVEGDAEKLPFNDASFDAVVSQFGHMFAPRPELAIAEMLRVLKPGGTIAFSTWPPELYVGRFFKLVSSYAPMPMPAGMTSPALWGDPQIVEERLGSKVKDLCFTRDVMNLPILSPQHMRELAERNLGPMAKVVQALEASAPSKIAELRRDVEALMALYFVDNHLRQDFLVTRATKV